MTNNDIHFILENSRAKHPAITQNGLQIFYDVKGKKDADTKRNTLIDMSGNNRHGHLTNFAYKKGSGYQGGLVFDGVDDTLTIPALTNIELVSAGVNTEMKIPQFTYQTNNNIVSFGPEGLVRFVRDGIPYERKGINLAKKQLHQGLKSNWLTGANITDFRKSSSSFSFTAAGINMAGVNWVHLNQADLQTIVGHKYLVTLELSSKTPEKNIYISHSYYDTQSLQARPEIQTYYVLLEVSNISNNPRFNITGEAGADITFRHFQVIDLTATYGAGNEPTLEAIQQEKEKWVFMPNPQELREAVQLRGNIMGDLENQVDDALVDKVIGTSPIVSTKSVDSVVDVEVQGQSYQLVQTGNPNQFNTETDFWHEGGGSFEVVPDTPMGFHLIGGEELGVLTLLRVVKNNGDWTVSFEAKGSGAVSVDICDLGTKNISLTADWQTFSVTANVTNFDANWSNFVDFETTNSDVWVRNIKVETGPIATPEPSPSPDNPSPIINMNKSFDMVSSVGKENLLPSNIKVRFGANNASTNPVTLEEKEENGKQFVRVTPNTYVSIYEVNVHAWITNNLIKGKTYTISAMVRPSENTQVGFNYGTPKQDVKSNIWTLISHSFDYSDKRIAGIETGSVGYIDIAIDWKIEEGSTATPYSIAPRDVAYNTQSPTIYKTNISLPEPLRSVGDVKDRLFRDTDGLWKVERKVGEKIANDTLAVQKNSSSISNYLYYYTGGQLPNIDISVNNISCSHLQKKGNVSLINPADQTLTNPIGINVGGGVIYMNAGTYLADNTSAGMKKWLVDNKVTFVYQLKIPTTETLPDDMQQKLNNIQSYKDSNYVYTVDDSGLTPTLHASFKPEAWYKENLLLNSLKVYNRTLTASEMLLNYGTEKERWGL